MAFYILLLLYLLPVAFVAYWLIRLAVWLVKAVLRLAVWIVRKVLVLVGKGLYGLMASLMAGTRSRGFGTDR